MEKYALGWLYEGDGMDHKTAIGALRKKVDKPEILQFKSMETRNMSDTPMKRTYKCS